MAVEGFEEGEEGVGIASWMGLLVWTFSRQEAKVLTKEDLPTPMSPRRRKRKEAADAVVSTAMDDDEEEIDEEEEDVVATRERRRGRSEKGTKKDVRSEDKRNET